MCRDWTKLNYTYDDLNPGKDWNCFDGEDGLIEDTYRDRLRTRLHEYYQGTAHAIGQARRDCLPIFDGPKNTAEQPEVGFKSTWADWLINVEYNRYALGGRSYSIEFYLGGKKGNADTNFVEENFVGRVYTFTGPLPKDPKDGGCTNCVEQAKAGVMSLGQVPLTIPLLHHMTDQVTDHCIKKFEDVERYLKDNLRWRFVELGGYVHSQDDKRFTNTVISVWRGTGESMPAMALTPAKPDAANTADTADKSKAKGATSYELLSDPFELRSSDSSEPEQPYLTPIYRDYEPIYHITAEKTWGAKDAEPFKKTHLVEVVAS